MLWFLLIPFRCSNADFLAMCGFTIELGTSTNVDLEIYPLNFGRVSQWNWWNFQSSI